MNRASFLWLEVTKKCQLTCTHCYADSGSHRAHGEMAESDWHQVIEDAAEVGVQNIQFIGGEPTLHPSLCAFIEHALALHLHIEIFSNLANVSQELWRVFSRPGVSLATSFYSDSSTEHEQITGKTGSFSRTTCSIREAVKRSIPIRVGIIEVLAGQRTEHAATELRAIGVTDIGVDKTRKVGRAGAGLKPNVRELCGKCTRDRLAVSPSGDVWPCVFSRWLPVGNVRRQSIREILNSEALAKVRTQLDEEFSARYGADYNGSCYPECNPACQPNCPPSCSPSCSPMHNCNPSGNCWPNYS